VQNGFLGLVSLKFAAFLWIHDG
jgi:hypothetical protein